MELLRTLAVLAEPPSPARRPLAEALELGPLPTEADHTDLFGFQLYPYASVYLGAEGMLGGEARDRVAGFWRSLGRTPPAEPDHLTVMLAFYAALCERQESAPPERRERWRGARKAYLWEHLLSWLPVYLEKLRELAPPFYRRWGELLDAALAEEAVRLGRQERLPLHLRAAPGLADPRTENARAFLASLLSPARSGLVLTRSDLARAARDLGAGLRIGERRFVLEAFFAQEPRAILGWLEREAAAWTGRHRRHEDRLGPVARFWASRAEAARRLAAELGREAEGSRAGP